MLEYIPKRRNVGGVRLDAAKSASTATQIRTATLPRRLFVPIDHGRCEPPTIVVEAGDAVLRGQVVADAPPGSDIPAAHASSSGTVCGVVDKLGVVGDELRSLICIEIETDARDTPCAHIAPGADVESRLEAIRAAGIVGLGGAAFPSVAKIRQAKLCKTLIVNGAECEPYISCDDMLMREAAAEIVSGCAELAELVCAGTCIIAIERDKPKAIESIRAAAIAFGDARIAIAELPSVYPAGGERQLIELLEALEVPSGGYPSDIGILCQNIGTTLAIHRALTTGAPLVERVVTVSGSGVASPCNLTVRIGTPIADVIEFCGGYTEDAVHLIVGGSMMGVSIPSDDAVVTKTTNCIIVAARDEFPAAESEKPCIRCGECALACPARLVPQELWRAAQAEKLDELATLGLADCIACGCCDVVCPSHIPLTTQFRAAQDKLAAHLRDLAFSASAQARFEAHTARQRLQEEAARSAQSALLARLENENAARNEIAAAVARARHRKQTPET